MRILICGDMFPTMVETVIRLLPDDEVRVSSMDPVDVAGQAPWAEVLIPAMSRISGEIIDACPHLRLIQQFGVGLEGVNIPAATAKGVSVANVPGAQAPVHAECTAEGGVFLMMATARKYKHCQQTLGCGEWGRPGGMALIDRTALIIGMGAVGRALASRLLALGMTVIGTELYASAETARELGLDRLLSPDRLHELLPLADFVISTVTLTPETRHLLAMPVFERMKPAAFVINISRGPIVNEDDLLNAIDGGLIAGAGLDVLNQEPPAPGHPLVNHPQVVVTPHTAGVTEQSFDALGRAVAENINRLRRGDVVLNQAVA